MKGTRRLYLWLLGFNLFVVAFATATALLLPAPGGWPDWMAGVWWLSAGLLSAGLLGYRRALLATGDENERRVAALSLAALPLLWGLFAVLAFWVGDRGSGLALGGAALFFALAGYAMQPGE